MDYARTCCKYISTFPYKIKRLYGIIKTKYTLFCNGVKYKRYKIIGSPIIDVNKGKIEFGDNFKMNNGLLGNQIGFSCPCILRAENGSINIGDNVGMSQTALIAKGADITIGNHVKIGGGVKIYTTDFHSLDFEKRQNVKTDVEFRKTANVTIDDDCFIGAGVIILKGVHIGARSVIGAGSVVSNDIPSDCVAGGNPCRVIREL